jgi:phage major head subunit gpT-like protein
MSRAEVADALLGRSRLLANTGVSTGDFVNIFRDVANKTLLKSYQEAPATWRPIVSVVSASDFKTIYGVALSEGPGLYEVKENGEYKVGYPKDKQESYALVKYGRIIGLSWEMMVNDDLRAFARVPLMLGAAARRKEGDVVYALLTGNPTLAEDSKALFHADHSNLEATSGLKGVVTSDNLSTARAAMRKQKGPDGNILDIQPAFLIVPVAQETDVEIILRSAALPDDNKSSGVFNPWAGRLAPIAEPRLDANSVKAWYLAADPSQVDTIEVAYLDGQEQPTILEREEWDTDAISYKCRHVFGAGVMEYRGFFKNPGA